MGAHSIPPFTFIEAATALIIAVVYIALSSWVKGPYRQKLSAIVVAGAGAAYLSGGLGLWELAFCTLITFLAFKGLTNYYYTGFAWLLHSGWDLLHHLYANPIVPFNSSSSAGCCVCDIVLAAWFFMQAPSLFQCLNPNKIKLSA